MDPLSITASAVAVLQAAGFATTTIYKFVQSIRTADSRIASLCDELSSLQNYLDSVRSTLDECRSRELVPVQPDLWQRCDEALKDCLVTLTLLEALVNRIKDSSLVKGKGLRWLARASIDLSIHGDALAAFREKIQKSNIALQTMLHTITLSLSLKNDASQDKILFELEQLRCSFKEALRVSLRSGRADNSDARISRNLHNLATAARQFHSAASSTSGTTRGGSHSLGSMRASSLVGDFPEHKRRQVEAFIQEGCYSSPGSVQYGGQQVPVVPGPQAEARASSPGTSPVHHTIQLRTMAMLGDEDDENEYEREYYDGLEDLARDRIMKGEYSKAIEFLTQATKRHADADPAHAESRSLQVQLALCHFLQGNWKAAEPMVMSLSTIVDGVSCNLLHALSLGYLSEYSFDSALETCRKAMHGKKWLLKVAPLGVKEYAQHDYAITMALFAMIHHMNGDPIRAEIFDRRLPQGFEYEHPVNALEFLVKHPGFLQKALGDDIPTSFTPVLSAQHLAYGVNTQPTGVVRNPSARLQWHGAFTQSPLRTRFAHFERYEDDTLKFVTAGPSPCSPTDSGIDMDEPGDVSPIQESPGKNSTVDMSGSGALSSEPTLVPPSQPRKFIVDDSLGSRERPDTEDTPGKEVSASSKWLNLGSPFGLPRPHGLLRKKLEGDVLESRTPTAVARRSKSFRLRNMVAALKKPSKLRQASQRLQYGGPDQKTTHVWAREDASRFMGVSTPVPEENAAVDCPEDLSERCRGPLHGIEGVTGSMGGDAGESMQATAGRGDSVGRPELADTGRLFKLSDTCITPVGIVDKWNMVSILTAPSAPSAPSSPLAVQGDTGVQGPGLTPERRASRSRADLPDRSPHPVSASSPKSPSPAKQVAEQIPSRLAAVLMSLPDASDTKKRLVVKSKLKALLRDVELFLYDPVLAQDLRGIIESLRDGAGSSASGGGGSSSSSSSENKKKRRRNKTASDRDLDALWQGLPVPKDQSIISKAPPIRPATTRDDEASLESALRKEDSHLAGKDDHRPTELLPDEPDYLAAEAESNTCSQALERPPGSTTQDRRGQPDGRLIGEEERPAAGPDLKRAFSFVAGDDARYFVVRDDQWSLPRLSVTGSRDDVDQNIKYLGTSRGLWEALKRSELVSG